MKNNLGRRKSRWVDAMERRLGSWVKNLRMVPMLRVLFRICKVGFKVRIFKREYLTNLRAKRTRSHLQASADWIRSWLLMRPFPKSRRKPWAQSWLSSTTALLHINQLWTSQVSSVRLWPSPHSSSTYGPKSARLILVQTMSTRITWTLCYMMKKPRTPV